VYLKILLATIPVLVLVLAWVLRYDVTTPNQLGYYTKLDRWTGSVTVCQWQKCN